MRVIVAGSRTITDYEAVAAAILNSGFEVTEVVSGKARGVDALGERWALLNRKPVKEFPADWEGLGKKAGHIRNGQMADYAAAGPEGGALVAIMESGGTPGTLNMIRQAKERKLMSYVVYLE